MDLFANCQNTARYLAYPNRMTIETELENVSMIRSIQNLPRMLATLTKHTTLNIFI